MGCGLRPSDDLDDLDDLGQVTAQSALAAADLPATRVDLVITATCSAGSGPWSGQAHYAASGTGRWVDADQRRVQRALLRGHRRRRAYLLRPRGARLVVAAEQISRLPGVRHRLFIPHHANPRIIDAVVRKVGLNRAVVATEVIGSGNTSAASIPVALTRLGERGLVRRGQLALLVGFGAGLAYAGRVVELP